MKRNTFLCIFGPCNIYFHVGISETVSFYLFYFQLHQMALVVFQCSHPLWKNSCKCDAKQIWINEMNTIHGNYIEHTILFSCVGTDISLNTKKHFLDFTPQNWQSHLKWGGWKSHHLQSAEVHLKKTRAKSHSSVQKWAISDSLGPTEVNLGTHILIGICLDKITWSWSKKLWNPETWTQKSIQIT